MHNINMLSQDLNIKKDISKSFCVLPWIHIATHTTGECSLCCIAKKNISSGGKEFNLEHESLENVWNSPYIRKARKDILEGKMIPDCSLCHQEELLSNKKMTLVSPRQGANHEWLEKSYDLIRERVKESQKGDGHIKNPPIFLDLRLGNVCNLHCRSCSPKYSIKIKQHFNNILKENPVFSKFYNPCSFPTTTWQNSEKLWSSLNRYIDTLDTVYLNGGEPTLLPQVHRFIKKCIEKGRAKHMTLLLNTNVTNLPKDFFLSLVKFKKVILYLSIDGVGYMNEYLRPPSQWNIIRKNILLLLRMPTNIVLFLSPVVQITNILHLPQLFEWISLIDRDKRVRIVPIISNGNPILDIIYLPPNIRSVALSEWKMFKEKNPNILNEDFVWRVELIINILSQPPAEGYKEKFLEYLELMIYLDKEYNQDIVEVFPSILKDCDLFPSLMKKYQK